MCREEWWTRSERIRTASEILVSFALVDAKPPRYQEIAREAERLKVLGLSFSRIGALLGVDDKTVAKALRWISQFKRDA